MTESNKPEPNQDKLAEETKLLESLPLEEFLQTFNGHLARLLDETNTTVKTKALRALRDANKMLHSSNKTWFDVLNTQVREKVIVVEKVKTFSPLQIARNYPMPFGKYKKMPLGEIELGDYKYLQWLSTQKLMDPLLRQHLDKILSVEF